MTTHHDEPRARRAWRNRMHHSPLTTHHSLGAAMTETVLVLPLLVFVLAMMVFFGRGMVRAQHARVMDRYATWRAVYGAPGPQWMIETGTQPYNQTFYGSKASELVRFLGDELPRDAEEELTAVVQQQSADAGTLLSKMYEVMPGGLTTGFRTSHTNTVAIYEKFEGPVQHRHTRAGNDWKFTNSLRDFEGTSWKDFYNDPMAARPFPPDDAVMGQWQPWPSYGNWWPGGLPVSLLLATREGLFDDLDTALENIESNGNPLAGELRQLFVREPGYRGATVHWTQDDEEQE